MRLTVEHLLYWTALLLAAAMRLFALGAMPLYPHEAHNAWLAWLVATGQSVQQSGAPSSALYHLLQSFIFLPGFTSDAVARLAPAVAGIALVALPWWWRSWLGRGAALVLAFLLAIDPWMVAFSRMADGTMLSIFFALLTLTAILYDPVDEAIRLRWQAIGAISAGLLLASGAMAWSFLPLLAVALFLIEPERRAALLNRQSALWLGGALVVAGSGLFLNPQLFGTVSRSLSLWLTQLTGSSADNSVGYPLGWWLVRIVAEQPFTLVWGAIGVFVVIRRIRADVEQVDASAQKWLLLFWLVWGIVLGVLPGRSPLALPMVGLPLLVLAALAVDWLWSRRTEDFDWIEGRMFLGLLIVLLVSGLFYTLKAISNVAFDATALQPIGLMVGLAMLLSLLYAVWLDSRQATVIVGSVMGSALLAATLTACWHLNYRDDSITPSGLYATATHHDVRLLAKDVATISAQRFGDPASMPVLVELNSEMQPDPVLGWYLHESQVRWVAGATTGEGIQPTPLLISTQANSSQSAIASTYMGSSYRLYFHWLPTDLHVTEDGLSAEGLSWQERIGAAWNNGWRARMRWLLYRESKLLLPVDEVTLWAP